MASPPRLTRRLALALACSLLLHGVLLLGIVRATGSPAPPTHREPPVEIELRAASPKPPPPPPARPPPPEPRPRFVPSALLARRVPKSAPPPPSHAPRLLSPPPPAQKVAPRPGPPVPIRIGVRLESTVAASDFSAPVGETLYGAAPSIAAPRGPLGGGGGTGTGAGVPSFVPPSQVAELPVLVREIKAPYPKAARKAGIEGEVVLSLTIDSKGRVAGVRRISGPGHGLDEAAITAVRQFMFKPARFRGEAVATDIRYVYSFEIE